MNAPVTRPPTDAATRLPRPRRPRVRPAAGLLALLAAPALGGDPPSGTPFIARTLLDHALASHPVLVHRIDASAITFTDARGLVQRRPIAEYLAILPGDGPTGWHQRDDVHTLALVDAQRFLGHPLDTGPGSVDDAPIAWDAGFARLSIPLDDVASLAAPGAPSPPAASSGDDMIHLANGDTLSGFILALGPECSIETSGGVAQIALPLMVWARVANPPEAPAAPLLWLADGTVACVELLPQSSPEAIAVRLLAGARSEASRSEDQRQPPDVLSFPLASVRALAFEPARLVPLGGIPVAATASDLPWTPGLEQSDAADEPLGAPDITLPAPMSAVWVIPAGAQRLAFGVSLPARARRWGDAELLVCLDQDGEPRELSRTRLSADAPVGDVNVELPAPADPRRERRLTVELLPGRFGPAQDTVTLHRPLLLLGAPSR